MNWLASRSLQPATARRRACFDGQPCSLRERRLVERAGIEPASSACEAVALPVELSSHLTARLCGRRGGQRSRVGDWLAGRSREAAKAGAWGWFRANLSAFSVRCFHQISFPGILTSACEPKPQRSVFAKASTDTRPMRPCPPKPWRRRVVRTAGIEPAPPEWRSGTLPLSHVRVVVGASPRIRTSRRPTCRFHETPVLQTGGRRGTQSE
jgi:hypothetical protein